MNQGYYHIQHLREKQIVRGILKTMFDERELRKLSVGSEHIVEIQSTEA